MEMISGIAGIIYQWITTHPFETLFIVVDLLFLYCFAAGWGFLISSDHTIKGPERAVPGRAGAGRRCRLYTHSAAPVGY